jgi:hypothetical protein
MASLFVPLITLRREKASTIVIREHNTPASKYAKKKSKHLSSIVSLFITPTDLAMPSIPILNIAIASSVQLYLTPSFIIRDLNASEQGSKEHMPLSKKIATGWKQAIPT